MATPRVGTIFNGRYRIDAILGRGASATVFRGTDTSVDRVVALKVLDRPAGGYAPRTANRFERETSILASLRDAHTVTMHDAGLSGDGFFFLVFEYIGGVDLEELIFQQGGLDEPQVIHILEQVLESLREAHSLGLLHRDIKPVNIRIHEYMGDPYHATLIDFGIARRVDEERRITKEGTAVGTPQFMAPEQLAAKGDLTPAADIYSLGIVAIEMLMGRPFLEFESAGDLLDFHVSSTPIQLPRDTRVSPPLRRIIEKMVVRQAPGRYQTAQAVLDDLRELATNTTTRMKPARDQSPGKRRASRDGGRRLGLFAGVFLALTLFVLVATLLYTAGDERRRPISPGPSVQSEPATVASAQRDTTSQTSGAPASAEEARTRARKAVTAAVDNGYASSNEAIGRDGCGLDRQQNKRWTADLEGAERVWIVETEAYYDPTEPHAVVLFLPDAGAVVSQTEFVAQSTFRELETETPKLLVSLQTRTPLPKRPWSLKREETAYIRYVVQHLRENYCVDADKVYAIGKGLAAFFLERARCDLGLSAMATTGYRNTLDGLECRPGTEVPLIHWAGEQDKWNPIDGGINCTGEERMTLDEKAELWRQLNHCSTRTRKGRSGDDFSCAEYVGCTQPLVVCKHDYGADFPNTAANTSTMLANTLFSKCTSPPMRFDVAGETWRFWTSQGRIPTAPDEGPDE